MKYLLFAIVLVLSLNNTAAQELPKKSKIFVRVYNEFGKKIAKGKIMQITDSTLVLMKGSSSITIPSADITYLNTKRTRSHNTLIGASAGLGLGIIGMTASNDGWASVAHFLLTPIYMGLGSGIGYLTSLFKESTQYTLAGDPLKWQGFKEEMYAPKY
ncbi:MAG: hypothetical protein ACJA1B_001220 [Polaribacter sp.]|jgi:hypothetical protein